MRRIVTTLWIVCSGLLGRVEQVPAWEGRLFGSINGLPDGVRLVVGFARVYVGAHLPLDVVGGWAIGVFAASGVHLILGVPSHPGRREGRAAPSARARSSIRQEG